MHELMHVPEPGGPGGLAIVGARSYEYEPHPAPGGGDGRKTQLVRGPQSAQSVHAAQIEYSPPAPPSSQSPSEAKRQVFTQVPEPGGPGGGESAGGGGGGAGGAGGRGGGGETKTQCARMPQSLQSVHAEHALYSEPAPPSSQSPSLAQRHEFTHVPLPGGPGAGDGGVPTQAPGERCVGGGGGPAPKTQLARGPQSVQSVHGEHAEYSPPAPPSSQGCAPRHDHC